METIAQPTVIHGIHFSASDCSCSCNPCSCNPCQCSDRRADYTPSWHMLGIQIQDGFLENANLTGISLIHLSLLTPTQTWLEVILFDSHAKIQHLPLLLSLLEKYLATNGKLDSHVDQLPIFQSQLDLVPSTTSPQLKLNFSTISNIYIRQGSTPKPPMHWQYDGPVSIQSSFQHYTS